MARVVLRRYLDFVGAQLDRARLEGAGIRATAVDAASFLPLTGIGGGVALEVDEADRARAEELLADAGLPDDEVADDPDGVRCPRCELEYTMFRKPPLPVGVVFAPVLVVPAALHLLFAKKRWYCSKCEHVWDDPKEGPRRMTALPEGIPRPVFRLRRGHPGMGLFLGWLIGMAATAVAVRALPMSLRPLGLGAMFGGPLLGWWVGRSRTSDVCSDPGCRAPLLPGVETCPSCKGAVVGTIRRTSEHFAEAAAFRREMAAAAAEPEKRKKATGKRTGKSKARREAEKSGDPAARVFEPPTDT